MVGLDGSEAKIDIAGLRRLYKASPVAQAALDHFGRRVKNSRVTTVDRLQMRLSELGEQATRNEIVELLRDLERLGFGTFVVGRKGKRSRFRWAVGLIEVGRAAAGEEVAVGPLDLEEPLDESEQPEAGGMREHRYWLRPELEVRLVLPQDLSTGEASRLADFIRTLPIA